MYIYIYPPNYLQLSAITERRQYVTSIVSSAYYEFVLYIYMLSADVHARLNLNVPPSTFADIQSHRLIVGGDSIPLKNICNEMVFRECYIKSTKDL